MTENNNQDSNPGNSRAISKNFRDALKDGLLKPILERIKLDEILMLALRGNYINIYYRGGNLIKITEQNGRFFGEFDQNYICPHTQFLKEEIEKLQEIKLDNDDGVKEWVNAIPKLKLVIDIYLGSVKDKHEREFQQLVARENNASGISNETEYFIADIEYTRPGLKARFDLLAIQWLANKRSNGSNCRLALIEMKYGDKAIGGTSGLDKHLKDIGQLFSDNDKKDYLLKEVQLMFDQLRDLGLIRFGTRGNENEVKLDITARPEVIILLANHNPRSASLMSELEKITDPENFDLRFFVSSFAGYGMHTQCMFKLKEFKELNNIFETNK